MANTNPRHKTSAFIEVGQANLRRYPGSCQSCGRAGELSAYDTSLWLSLFSQPIFPRGRRRVLDLCSRCGARQVLRPEEAERVEQGRIQETLQVLQSSGGDASKTMQLHACLVSRGRAEEAEELFSLMEQRYRDESSLQVYLGEARESQGRLAEARAHLQRALELEPDSAEAKAGLGLIMLREGEMDKAKEQLRFLREDSDLAVGVGVLLALARAYEEAGCHPEAHHLHGLLLERYPAAAQDPEVRRMISQTEQALGVEASRLPPVPTRALGLAVLGLATLVVVLVLANLYLARHRPVHVVNGFEQAVTVSVDGASPLPVPARARRTLNVSEGEHRAVVAGPVAEEIRFVVRPGLRDRWFGRHEYILNPGGAALLIAESMGESGRKQSRLLYKERFVIVPKPDYLFSEFPGGEGQAAAGRSRIDVLNAPVQELFYSLAGSGHEDAALDFLEWHLRLHPDQIQLLPTYVGMSLMRQREDKARALLAWGAGLKPVRTQWHRLHQDLELMAGQHQALISNYDRMLLDDPKDAALLYLRGRLSTSRREALTYYERAVAIDPENAFAQNAIGYSYATMGDWETARKHLATACALRPGDDQMEELYLDTRLATGDLDALEKEYRARVAAEPFVLETHLRLAEILAARQRWQQLGQLGTNYLVAAASKYGAEGEHAGQRLLRQIAYLKEDYEGFLRLTGGEATHGPEAWDHLYALIGAGRLEEALRQPVLKDLANADPFVLLALQLALESAGLADPARRQRQIVLAVLRAGRPEYALAAAMLDGSGPVSLSDVLDLSLPPAGKAVLLTALARRFPQQAAEMKQAARRLNVRRQFPYHLINRLTRPDAAAHKVCPSTTPWVQVGRRATFSRA